MYLHRHSRQTRSNDIAPLARGTALEDMLRVNVLVVAGANAAERVATDARRRAMEAFIVQKICWILDLDFVRESG